MRENIVESRGAPNPSKAAPVQRPSTLPHDFTRWFHEHRDPVYRFVRFRVASREVAEDVTSEVFMKALRSLHRYNAKRASPRTWLLRIARNAVTDHLRTLRRRGSLHVSLDRVPDLVSNAQSQEKPVLKEAVPRGDARPGSKISDLFLLNAANPGEEEVRRTATWVRPNIGLVPENGEVGVLFELYEMHATEDFALRVFLAGEDGLSRPVSFRPAGETRYRTTWRRSGKGDYRMTEYITVNLEPFPSGNYTLTVRALRAGQEGEIEASRPVRIR